MCILHFGVSTGEQLSKALEVYYCMVLVMNFCRKQFFLKDCGCSADGVRANWGPFYVVVMKFISIKFSSL